MGLKIKSKSKKTYEIKFFDRIRGALTAAPTSEELDDRNGESSSVAKAADQPDTLPVIDSDLTARDGDEDNQDFMLEPFNDNLTAELDCLKIMRTSPRFHKRNAKTFTNKLFQ